MGQGRRNSFSAEHTHVHAQGHTGGSRDAALQDTVDADWVRKLKYLYPDLSGRYLERERQGDRGEDGKLGGRKERERERERREGFHNKEGNGRC